MYYQYTSLLSRGKSLTWSSINNSGESTLMEESKISRCLFLQDFPLFMVGSGPWLCSGLLLFLCLLSRARVDLTPSGHTSPTTYISKYLLIRRLLFLDNDLEGVHYVVAYTKGVYQRYKEKLRDQAITGLFWWTFPTAPNELDTILYRLFESLNHGQYCY